VAKVAVGDAHLVEVDEISLEQISQRIPMGHDAGPTVRKLSRALMDRDCEACLVQQQGRGEAAQRTTNDYGMRTTYTTVATL
jgi:hypothetical protein